MTKLTHLVTLVACGLAMPVVGYAAPKALTPGDRCEITSATPASTKAKGEGKKTKLNKGDRVRIVRIQKGWAELRLADMTLFARSTTLSKTCRVAKPLPTAPPPAIAANEPELVAPPPTLIPLNQPPAAPAGPVPPPSLTDIVASEPPLLESPAAAVEPPPPPPTPLSNEQRQSNKTKIAVMELRASPDLPKEFVSSLTDLVPQVLDDLGPFKAITSNDIMQMLAMEALKQSVGCDSVSCLAEIGGAIGADYLVTGSVLTVGTSYLLQFQLMNIAQGRVEERVSRDYNGGPKGLVDEVRTATKLLVRNLLASRSGTLAVTVTEEGATIRVDGTLVGVSPMGVLPVAGGVHVVAIEKEGFILFSRDVEIQQDQPSTLFAALVPSDEFKRRYSDHAGFVRTLAWGGISGGTIATGAGIGLYLWSRSQASTLRSDINNYNQPGHFRTSAELTDIDKRTQDLARMESWVVIAAGVGVATLATGLVLYLTGDDPARYHAETQVEALPPGLQLQPTVGGALLSLTWAN